MTQVDKHWRIGWDCGTHNDLTEQVWRLVDVDRDVQAAVCDFIDADGEYQSGDAGNPNAVNAADDVMRRTMHRKLAEVGFSGADMVLDSDVIEFRVDD